MDTDMKFKNQVQHIVQKETKEFSRMRGMIGRDWGVDYNAALLFYKAIYIPRITYGASIWMAEWSRTDRERLDRGQRTPLLAVSGAYRTAPTEGLQVITGLLPIDIKILWEGTRQETNRGIISPEAQEDLRSNLLNMWQTRWDNSSKGRWTHRFFKDIRFRLAIPLELDHYVTQYLTGHGNFAAKLHSLSLRDSPNCSCGEGNDDAEHAIYKCSRWNERRQSLMRTLTEEGRAWPCEPAEFTKTRKIYSALRRFARYTLISKEENEHD